MPAAGIGSVTDTSPARKSAPPKKTSITPGARATSAAVTAERNKTYAFRAQGKDKAPYNLDSVWSAWCQFKVDTTVPPVTASVLVLPPGPGQKGQDELLAPPDQLAQLPAPERDTLARLLRLALQGGDHREEP